MRIWPLKYDGNRIDFDPFIGEVVESSATNKTDKIVLLRNCAPPLEDRYRLFQNSGAKAIICAVAGYPGSRPGHQMYSVDGSGSSDIVVPIFSLIIGELEKHWKPYEPLIVRVETEPNEFMQVYESPWIWVWQISMTGIILYTFVFVLYRLYQLVKYHNGFKPTIAYFCLILLLLATIATFLAQCIDPLGVHNIFSYWLWEILFTAPFSLIMAPLMLMTLWWQKVLSSLKVAINSGLSRFKWVFYAWVALVFLQEIIGSAIRVINQETYVVISLVSATFYIINSLSVLIYCSVTLYQLQRRVESMMERSDHSGKELKKIKNRLVSLIILIVIFCVVYILFVSRITEFPIPRLVYWWFFWVTACMLITLQALTISPPRCKPESKPTGEYEPNRSRIQTRNRSVIARINCNQGPMYVKGIFTAVTITSLRIDADIERHISTVKEDSSDIMTEPSSSESETENEKKRLSEPSKMAAKNQLKGWRSAFGAFKKTMFSSQTLVRPRLAKSAQVMRKQPTFNRDLGEDSEDYTDLSATEDKNKSEESDDETED